MRVLLFFRKNVPVLTLIFSLLYSISVQANGGQQNLEGLGYNNSVAVDPFENKPPTYQRLAAIMRRMWVSFIVNGDPNTNNGTPGSTAALCGLVNPTETATSVHWPVYMLDNPQNIVFNANVTNLLYAEPDYYRAEGIQYISDRFISVYGR